MRQLKFAKDSIARRSYCNWSCKLQGHRLYTVRFFHFVISLSCLTFTNPLIQRNLFAETCLEEVFSGTKVSSAALNIKLRPEAKVHVVLEGLTEFFGGIELDSVLLEKAAKKLNRSPSLLKVSEVKKLVRFLIPALVDPSTPSGKRQLRNFFLRSFIPDLKNHFTHEFFQTQSDEVVLNALEEKGYLTRSTTDRVRAALSRKLYSVSRAHIRSLTTSITVNGLLFYLGLVPLHFPKLTIIKMRPGSQEFKALLNEKKGLEAYRLMRAQLRRLHAIDGTQKSIRTSWHGYLFVMAAVLMIYDWEKILFLISQNTVTDADLQRLEAETYSPEKVIQQQYDSWLQSLSEPPEDWEKQEMLEILQIQEEQGLLRIFAEEEKTK